MEYQVALSFANEDREQARALAQALENRSIRVFFDEYERGNLWGKDLYIHLSEVYERQAQYCVMLLSKHYASEFGRITSGGQRKHEPFKEAGYILPVRLDGCRHPWISPTVAHLQWSFETVDSIADKIVDRIRGRESEHQPVAWQYSVSSTNDSDFIGKILNYFRCQFSVLLDTLADPVAVVSKAETNRTHWLMQSPIFSVFLCYFFLILDFHCL